MAYNILLPDGSRFGPAETDQVAEWVKEGRVFPGTTLEDAVTGQCQTASSVPGLFPAELIGGPGAPVSTTTMVSGSPGGHHGFIPQTANYAQQGAMINNNSGFRGQVPAEVEKMGWSWGGFALSWLWLMNHRRVGWGLALLLGPGIVLQLLVAVAAPVAKSPATALPFMLWYFAALASGLVAQILCGINGHKWAWQYRRYADFQHFVDTERTWNTWGLVLFIISVVSWGLVFAAGCLLSWGFLSTMIPHH